MNVNDLIHGQTVLIVYPGVEDSREVTDYDRGVFAGWSDEGINVTAHGFDLHVPWGARFYVADPVTGVAVSRFRDDEVLPATRAENE